MKHNHLNASFASCVTCGQSIASHIDARPYEPPATDLLYEALRGITMAQYNARIVRDKGEIPESVMRALETTLDTIYTQVLHAVIQSRGERLNASYRLSNPDLGPFGPIIATIEDARAIAHTFAHSERAAVDIVLNDSGRIVETIG